jgi:thiamine-phosphate pyrophosphorylase
VKRLALPFELLLITDEVACRAAGRDVPLTVAKALQHVDAERVGVLVRDKRATTSMVRATCAALQPTVQERGARLLVHTHVDVAKDLGLDGVHLSATEDPARARAELGDDLLLGVSRHRGDPLDDEALLDCDYAMLSPIWAPSSKPGDDRATLGPAGLAAAARDAARPLVALGGIDASRALLAKGAGAAAVAVLGGVMGAEDPGAVVRDILDALVRAVRPGGG